MSDHSARVTRRDPVLDGDSVGQEDDEHAEYHHQESGECDPHTGSRTPPGRLDRTLKQSRPPTDTRATPEPPRGWLSSTKEAFTAYWDDQVASLATPSVGALVDRYFDLMDEHTRALRDVRRQRHTTGSTGQLVMHPSAGYLVQLEGAMQKLEQSLGISPQARSRMRLETASTEATLDRIFARARGEDE